MEVGTLLLGNDKNNAIADYMIKMFLVFQFPSNNFLLANADLLKISAFIFFDKIYLQ